MHRREFIEYGVAALAGTAMPMSSALAKEVEQMTPKLSRDELVARLIKAGEVEVLGAPPEEIASDFDTDAFRFHGPAGFETDYNGLQAYICLGSGCVR